MPGWQDDPIVQPAQQAQGGSWQDDPVVQPAPRSGVQEFGRQLALTGRAGVEGVTDLASVFANPVGVILNAGLKSLGIDYQFPEQSQAVSQALTDAGVAQPETKTEQVVNSIGRRATGAAASMGIGSVAASAPGVTGQVGASLASNPVVQAASSVTGPLAREAAVQAGAGPVGQFVADFAGSLAPGAASFAGPSATRAGFRGGEQGRQTVEQNIDSFGRAGTTPSVGQATESRVMRGTESLLSRTPGGAGPMVAKAESQADDLAKTIELRASQLAKKTSAEQAGRQIQREVSGEGGFIDQFKAKQGALYDELDKFIPPSSSVDVGKTRQALDALNQNIKGAEAVSKFFQNSKIKGIQQALETDAGDAGKLPYEAVKKLRTLVGREMADSGIASDVPRSKWKALYGALSEDLGGAVKGNPKAEAAWSRANNYTKAGMRRIESIESVIDKSGGPEAIFKAATANTKEGATTLRSVMQSLDDEGRRMVSATVLRRLGIAKAGVQGELGDQFSTESFLTNWNMLSKEAKATLFDRYGPQFRGDIDQIAKFTSNLREGSQVFKNPSGTAQAAGQAATIGGLAASVVTGNFAAAAAILGGMGAANLSARLMTNPRFVRWLAQTTKVPAGATGSAVTSLAQLAKSTGDEDIATAAAILEKDQKDKQK
jgi:hypothetical protein